MGWALGPSWNIPEGGNPSLWVRPNPPISCASAQCPTQLSLPETHSKGFIVLLRCLQILKTTQRGPSNHGPVLERGGEVGLVLRREGLWPDGRGLVLCSHLHTRLEAGGPRDIRFSRGAALRPCQLSPYGSPRKALLACAIIYATPPLGGYPGSSLLALSKARVEGRRPAGGQQTVHQGLEIQAGGREVSGPFSPA